MFDNTSKTSTDNSDVGSTSTDDSENESNNGKEDINHEVESSSSETNEGKERDSALKCVIINNELNNLTKKPSGILESITYFNSWLCIGGIWKCWSPEMDYLEGGIRVAGDIHVAHCQHFQIPPIHSHEGESSSSETNESKERDSALNCGIVEN